jgi:hypothetical protein
VRMCVRVPQGQHMLWPPERDVCVCVVCVCRVCSGHPCSMSLLPQGQHMLWPPERDVCVCVLCVYVCACLCACACCAYCVSVCINVCKLVQSSVWAYGCTCTLHVSLRLPFVFLVLVKATLANNSDHDLGLACPH